MIYCLVGPGVPAKIRWAIERMYGADPNVVVIPERRSADRRRRGDRRQAMWDPFQAARTGPERRLVRNADGMRVTERRGVLISAGDMMRLPRGAGRYADHISFGAVLSGTADWMDDIESDRLIARIQLGDAAAFEHLYKRWFDRVYRCLRMAGGGAPQAEAEIQEVFADVLARLPDYHPGRGPFRSWLARAVCDRSDSADTMAADDQDRMLERWPVPADRRMLDALSDEELFLLAGRLPAEQRDIIRFHYLLGLSRSQIADVFGQPIAGVDELHERALRFMGACVAAVAKRPGYSGRHPMLARRRPAPVIRERMLALM